MKDHIKRRIEYSKDVVPEEGTLEYEKFKSDFAERLKKHPDHKQILKKLFKKAVNTLEVQVSNGMGLNMDIEIRYYLQEFNHRSWNFGHKKMPIMFNIMEAFFDLDKSINYWQLLEEENYLISFFDFLDYYTSTDFIYDKNSIKENLENNLIYHYNVGADIDEITFKTDEGSEFVIAGISMIRRGDEVTLFFITGEILDTTKKTKELKPIPENRTPGKEKIQPDESRKQEAVMLNNNPNLWKVVIACRFDLDTETIDARYVAKDAGNSYQITTDDITGFIRNGTWLTTDIQKAYELSLKKIENYNSIFELAKAALNLPYYFNKFEDCIIEEDHDTEIKSLISNPIKKSKYKDVEDRFKIRKISLWLLNRKNIFSADRIILRDDNFKIETTGYWKNLENNEFGTDKKGNQVTGKTWVNKTESYYQGNTDKLIISKADQKNEFEGENAGYIYIMRNMAFEKNIFKIGLTTIETKDRAEQLSNTSVPDRFYVIREWGTRDCKKAEKEIHILLQDYRIDPRREFFKTDLQYANGVIDKVVSTINKGL